ncbi:response regulator transcription factor [Streptomyces griseus]|uniref:response regulator transcription factor n=1 Tax=Streptomyces griseus TaxID=1911 RepID=UPI000563B217|nr:response regulator transcription factor [Streptomyces griseus]
MQSAAPRPLVLLALRDARVVDLVGGMLRAQGHEVLQTTDGPATRRALRERRPQGVLLSLELPRCDPWRLLTDLRAHDHWLPLVVTAPVYVEIDAARAYRLGADDYVTYSLSREQGLPRLAARFRRLLPRPGAGSPAAPAPERVVIDRAAHTAKVDGKALDLTPLEFGLLAALAARPEQVLSQGQLLREVWGAHEDGDPGRVKYTVLRLRRKIAAATGGRTGISTVRGVGYRYHPAD